MNMGWLNFQLAEAYDAFSDYEYRINGLLGTKFLISGVIRLGERYTINRYEAEISDPKAVPSAATEDAWQAGRRYPVARRRSFTLRRS